MDVVVISPIKGLGGTQIIAEAEVVAAVDIVIEEGETHQIAQVIVDVVVQMMDRDLSSATSVVN